MIKDLLTLSTKNFLSTTIAFSSSTWIAFRWSMLAKAIKAISGTFKKKKLGMLSGSRNATIIPQEKQVDGANKFELITWLVLK